MREKLDDSGVSPVIGVLLMIGLVVAVGALATTVVFDVSDVSTSSNADITLDTEQSSGGVTVTVIRNGNVANLELRDNGGLVGEITSPVEAGDTVSNSSLTGGDVQVLAQPEGQTEFQVIQTIDR